MKNAANWFLSSFFRTLGKIFVYLLLALGLLYLFNDINLPHIDIAKYLFFNVSADAGDWVKNVKYVPTNAGIFNCTSNGCSSVSSNWNYIYYENPYGDNISVLESSNNLTIANNGVIISYFLNSKLKSDYIYLIKTYYCTGITANWDTFSGNINLGGSLSGSASVSQTGTLYESNSITLLDGNLGGSYGSCFQGNSIIVPNGDKQYAGYRLTSNTSRTTEVAFVGFDYEVIGLYNGITINDLNSAISNSGFATATSVSQVQQSVNQVQSELIGVNDSIQDQIDADAQNTQDMINSQKVCTQVDKQNIVIDNYYLSSSGENVSSSAYGITDYINIYNSSFNVLYTTPTSSAYTCFYNVNKALISCVNNPNLTTNFTVPSNSYYFRTSIHKVQNRPQFEICKNGNQATNDTLNDMNSSINNSDSSGATGDASNFFSNFTTDTHGLTGIITAPLSAIQSLTSSSCSPLVLPLPYVNENLTLPCMRDIYTQYFGGFMQLYDIITLGIISYWVMVRIFGLVKDFKNPEHDEIEVLDL